MLRKMNRIAAFACMMLATAFLFAGAGCTQDSTEPTAQTSADASRPAAAKPAEAPKPDDVRRPAEPARSEFDMRAHADRSTEQALSDPSTARAPESEWGEQPPLVIEDEAERKAMAENMIYATIRIKMEDFIEQRQDLLKAGRHPTDVEVRRLEGSIMRARELLMEAGEIVEDVVPPIVQVTPRD